MIIHSGSRNFGLQVAKYHQKIAENYCKEQVKKITDWKNKNIGKWKQGLIKINKVNGTVEDWINNNGIPPIISIEYKLPEIDENQQFLN